MPVSTAKTILLAVLLAATAAGCGSRKASPEEVAETLPRYGDATRQTIWDRATPAERLELPEESRRAGERGWSYAEAGRLDDAMRRFNQAWLLDPQNERALWGMAVVQFERARADSATKKGSTPATLATLDSAVSLVEDALTGGPVEPTGELLTDAAFMRATRGGTREKLSVGGAGEDFDAAGLLLRRAQAIRTTPQVLETWATLEEYRGYPRRAAEYRARARQLRRDGEVGPVR